KLYDRATGGGWKTLSETLRKAHIPQVSKKFIGIWQLRDDTSKPGNFAAAKAQWDAALAAWEIPRKKAPTFASYNHPKDFPTFEYATDHKDSLGTFWNAGEKNKDDATRSATTLNQGNLRVITAEENAEKSVQDVRFDPDVGPDFSSVVANS